MNAYDLYLEGFKAVTEPIAVFFSFLLVQLGSIFNGIPTSAIEYVMIILVWSVLSILALLRQRSNGPIHLVFLVFHSVGLIITVLYMVWKIQLITYLENNISSDQITSFFEYLVYMLFAVVILLAFYRSDKRGVSGPGIKTIKKGVKIVIWGLFFLTVYVLEPVLQGYMLTMTTFIQTWLLVMLFMLPNVFLYEVAKLKDGASHLKKTNSKKQNGGKT